MKEDAFSRRMKDRLNSLTSTSGQVEEKLDKPPRAPLIDLTPLRQLGRFLFFSAAFIVVVLGISAVFGAFALVLSFLGIGGHPAPPHGHPDHKIFEMPKGPRGK
jgi:hypothetical protein